MANTADYLIGDLLVNFAQRAFDGSETSLPLYLNLYSGPMDVGGGDNPQTIQTVDIPLDTLEWFLEQLWRLDQLISLDFYFLDHNNGSLIDIYFDSEIELGTSSTVLGLAVPNHVSSSDPDNPYEGLWWEIFLNAPNLSSDEGQLRYALIHEFGHALGLEHPFDDFDDDVWGTVNDGPDGDITVMSYIPPAGSWPDFYSPLDRAALATIWGLDSDTADKWLFLNADGQERSLSTRHATRRLRNALEGEQLLGPQLLIDPELPPLKSLAVDDLLPDDSANPSVGILADDGIVFVAFTETTSADPRLVSAYTSGLELIDSHIEVDFQFIEDPSSPLVDLLLDRSVVEPGKLSLGAGGALSASLVEFVDLLDGTQHRLQQQVLVSVDPLNPYYQNQGSYEGLDSYLSHASLQALLLGLGLEYPWLVSDLNMNEVGYSQTVFATHLDELIIEPQLSSLDIAALQQLYGIEEQQSQPLLTTSPSLTLGTPSADLSADGEMVIVQVPIERTLNDDVVSSALLQSALTPYHHLSLDSEDLSPLPVEFAPGVTQQVLNLELALSTWSDLSLSLSDPYQAVLVPEEVHFDLHNQLRALLSPYLIDHRLLQPEVPALLLDQGSELLFVASDPNLDPRLQDILEQYLSTLDDALDLDINWVPIDSSLAQWEFYPGLADHLVQTTLANELTLGEHVFSGASVLQSLLPAPLDASDEDGWGVLKENLWQQLLLAVGLERPSDASDGDHYFATPVFPSDSSLFTHRNDLPVQVELTDLDLDALHSLYAAEDDDVEGDPLAGSLALTTLPKVSHTLELDSSGAVQDGLKFALSLKRTSNLQLSSSVVLAAWSGQVDEGVPLWSSKVNFAPGEDHRSIDWIFSESIPEDVVFSCHGLTASSPNALQLVVGAEQLQLLSSRSPITSFQAPPHRIELSKYSFPESLHVGESVADLSGVDVNFNDIEASSFELVSGLGDVDNDAFVLDGDQLLLAHPFDFYIQPDASVRLRITDSDGLFREQIIELTVEDVLGPPLHLAWPTTPLAFVPGVSQDFPLVVSVQPDLSIADPKGVRIFFDSSVLSLTSSSGVVVSDLSADLDNDTTTDSRLEVSLEGQLPDGLSAGESFSVGSIGLQPVSVSSRFDPLTGIPLASTLNFSVELSLDEPDMPLGHVAATAFNLDVDGDGEISALGDGLMIMRKLFGNAFSGDALTDSAINLNRATRSTAEIHSFIQQGIDQGQLDVDGDGATTALGDGLMIIRSLFGSAFTGIALIDQALNPMSDLGVLSPEEASEIIRNKIQALHSPDAQL